MRFIWASVALGLMAFWGSEVLFWSAPKPDFSALDVVATVVAYVLCASLALGVVVRAGVQGLTAAFLGGVITGFLVEGALVGTIYDAFPLQLVWVPVAWHGVITGGVVVGLGRVPGARAKALVWAGLGVFGGVWALYWPLERAMPGAVAVVAYLAGLGLLVPLGHSILDRVGEVKVAPWWAMALPALVVGAAWVWQGVASLDPLRLVLPVVLAGLVWLAFRLGDRGPLRLGAPVPVWRHGVFLLAPLVTAAIAVWGGTTLGGLPTNWPVVLGTSAVGLIWLGRLVWRAR